MKRWLLALAIGSVSGGAQSAPAPASDERIIVASEKAWGGAFVSGDTAVIEQLVADDYQGVESSGRVVDKPAVLAEVRQGPNLTSIDTKVLSVRFFGATAVAIGEDRVVGSPPQRRAGRHAWTDTWVRRGGRWRIVASADLNLPAPVAAGALPRGASCSAAGASDACAFIVQAEKKLTAMLVTGDVSAIRAYLAEDAVWTLSDGRTWTKAQAIEKISHGPRMVTSELVRADVTVFGDAATVQWTERWTRAGAPGRPGETIGTDTWLKRDGRWQIVASQEAKPVQ